MLKPCATCLTEIFALVAFDSVVLAVCRIGRRHLRRLIDRCLQRQQRVHVRLIGRRDIAIDVDWRDDVMHGLEGFLDAVGALNLGEVDAGVLRCEPEQAEDRAIAFPIADSTFSTASLRSL